jgi:beta-lactamase regulating signal transducer with metallopeptidase domain
MIAWMVYTGLVGVLVAVATSAIDRLARLAGRPTRWVWIVGVVAAVGLAAIAPYRAASPDLAVATVDSARTITVRAVSAETWWSTIQYAARETRSVIDASLVGGLAAIERRLPVSAGAFALFAWLVASAVLALVAVRVHTGFGRARRRWPVADIHGTRVRVSPSTGPVVIGLARPEIVVPRWMLQRAPSEQRVVLAHEAEHVRAGDALVLATASAAAILMPWNPALWYMLSRVRLAVELDCDARVLRGGVAAMAYGTLLIDLAEQALPLKLTAVALADDVSHLHRRILAMKPQSSRFAFVRGGAAAAVALAGFLVACEAKMPTESDIKQMDASSAERRALQLGLITRDSVRYVVDGVATSEQAAKSLSADSIKTVNVTKSDGRAATLTIRTNRAGAGGDIRVIEDKRRQDSTEVNGRNLVLKGVAVTGTTPLFIVDGVRTDQATFAKLDRDHIASVEVLKGKAAAQTYGPDGEHGVIVVTTKK